MLSKEKPEVGTYVVASSTGSVAKVTAVGRDPESDRFHVKIIDAQRHHKNGDHLVWTLDMVN